MISSQSDMQAQSKIKTPSARQMPERFSQADLESLRGDMLQSGLDTWQAGELITAFLTGRGYGVSNEAARSAAGRIEELGCTTERMQVELEKLAFVM